MREQATGIRRARSRSAVGLALATLAFPPGAHADDGLPEPELDVQAIVEQVVAEAPAVPPPTVEIPPLGLPALDVAPAPEPVEAPPEPPAESLPVSQATEPAQADTAAAATMPSPAGDTAQYHPPAEPAAGSEPPPEPAAEPEPAQPEAAVTAPSEWIWIWNWDCGDPPAAPEPTGTSWTWIWNWNCGTAEAFAGAVAPEIAEQYQAELDRYQQANADLNSPLNFNVSIRIFSPGDDGPVTQVNSAAATVTSLARTTIEQTIRQALPVVFQPLPQLPTAGPPPEAPGPELVAPLDSAAGPGAKPVVTRPGTAAKAARAHPTQDRAGWATTTAVRAAPALERRAPAPRTRGKPAPSGPEPVAPPLPAFVSAAGGGSSSGAGAGAAFAAFLIALTLAYLVIPPGIAYRVRFAEARMPRGVDLGGDDRPG